MVAGGKRGRCRAIRFVLWRIAINGKTNAGGGGRQYVLAEYVRYCKEMLKDGAEEGDWICVTCRNAVRSRASTLGVDLNGDAKVWLTRWRKLNLCLI